MHGPLRRALDHMTAAHHDAEGATHAWRQKARTWFHPATAAITGQ